jgi:hypothetical protein
MPDVGYKTKYSQRTKIIITWIKGSYLSSAMAFPWQVGRGLRLKKS